MGLLLIVNCRICGWSMYVDQKSKDTILSCLNPDCSNLNVLYRVKSFGAAELEKVKTCVT